MKLEKSWKERIAEAEERGHFTEDDKAKIARFDTCFVGEHYDKPIGVGDLTIEELALAYDADDVVYDDDIEKAIEIYEEVQKLYE